MHQHDRAEMYGGVIRVLLDDDRVLDLEIQFLDRALVCRLLVAGGVILGILREVAVAARLGDALHDLRALDLLKVFELFDRLIVPLLRHGKFCHLSFNPLFLRAVSAAAGLLKDDRDPRSATEITVFSHYRSLYGIYTALSTRLCRLTHFSAIFP